MSHSPDPTITLATDPPAQLSLFLTSELTSSFYVISSRALTDSQRAVSITAKFLDRDGNTFACVKDQIIRDGTMVGNQWVYQVPLEFTRQVELGSGDEDEDAAAHKGCTPSDPPTYDGGGGEEPIEPIRIFLGDGDGALTITGGLSVTYEISTYKATEPIHIYRVTNASSAGLPREFLSGSPAGFESMINISGGGTTGTPRTLTAYYYRDVTMPVASTSPVSLRITRVGKIDKVVPGGFLSVTAKPQYVDPDTNVHYSVTELVSPLPRMPGGSGFGLPTATTGDGTLTYTGNGVQVSTEVTFNGSID